MATVFAQPAAKKDLSLPQEIVADARGAKALEWLTGNLDWIQEQHIRITEIAAPPFREAIRGVYLRKLLNSAGLKLRTDEIGNVIGERPGEDAREVVILSAHLDTVFPAGTDVQVKVEGSKLRAPGISDNGVGLAALVAVARALHDGKIRTRRTVVFVANVGEEGEGNLRGMRKLVESYRGRIRAVIALDGPSIEQATTMALASRRLEVAITGPGGHSWSDFGMPNPIHALSRGLARFVRVKVPDDPRTTFNVGTIEGGRSVNSIPDRAAIKVDMRSESEPEIDRLENTLRESVNAGLEEELSAARDRGAIGKNEAGRMEVKIRSVGGRPGGELPANSPLLAALQNADKFLNVRSRLERSSTDANIPLSLGIPAIAIGAGGRGGGSHSLDEWYDSAGRELGLKRILLTLLGVAGVEP
ncbi:MAG: M20/M25/M40 family metallo-hydrolase [Acidobacteria bacterium]|nr:M20/M25/M40 family metallo-hydrolase [Acidobacteriota bacterium]